MTSFLIEQVNAPASSREARVQDAMRRRTADELAGRTVWCANALEAGRGSAGWMHEHLRWTSESGTGADSLDVPASEQVRRLAERLDAMMTGTAERPARLDTHDHEIYAEGMGGAGAAIEGRIRPDDVVMLHDPATTTIADAVRDRGAHAVWQLRMTAGERSAVAEARAFLAGHTASIDALVVITPQRPRRGVRMMRIAAVIPAGDIVAAKDVALDEPASPETVTPSDLGLSSLLAFLLEADRAETVGGTRRPRPVVSPH